jgi:hypothetical protein
LLITSIELQLREALAQYLNTAMGRSLELKVHGPLSTTNPRLENTEDIENLYSTRKGYCCCWFSAGQRAKARIAEPLRKVAGGRCCF